MYKAKEPGKLVMQFKAESKDLKKKLFMAQIPARRQEKNRCLNSVRQSEFSLPLPFCSILAFSGLDDTYPGGRLPWWLSW